MLNFNRDYLEKLLGVNSITETARLLGVSDTSVRRWVSKYNLKTIPPKDSSIVYMYSLEFGNAKTAKKFKMTKDAVHTLRSRYKKKEQNLLMGLNKD